MKKWEKPMIIKELKVKEVVEDKNKNKENLFTAAWANGCIHLN